MPSFTKAMIKNNVQTIAPQTKCFKMKVFYAQLAHSGDQIPINTRRRGGRKKVEKRRKRGGGRGGGER